jgi:c-di-GMP-binding flagellar brake protein YcgR
MTNGLAPIRASLSHIGGMRTEMADNSSTNGSTILKDAIARNAGAILSLPSAGMVRHHKTRFLAETEEGFWVESAPAERPLVNALIAEQTPVGIAFKSGHTSLAFTTPIRSRNERFPINATTIVEALFLPFPQNLHPRQRRQFYRVRLPHDHEIGLRLWRLGQNALLQDEPLAATELSARLADISVGGLGAICDRGSDGRPPRITTQDRLRILLRDPAGAEVLLEGRAVHVRPLDDGRISAGVQFKKLEKNLEGRQTFSKLSKLVGQLEREEVRKRALHAA